MDTPGKKEELAQRIRARIAHDKFWGAANLYFAQILVWVAVLFSFGAAIAATEKSPAILTASLAAIPGCVIVLSRNLNFMPLSRWHYKLAARLQAVEFSLQFENKTVEEVSRDFSKVMGEFESYAPGVNVGGLLEQSEKDDKRPTSS
jgi:hypothetical protein